MDSPWLEPAWLATAHAWIDERLTELGLARVGPVEQPHVHPWSTVMRVPTAQGDVWFKANEDRLAYESAVVELLAARVPDLVPPLLSRDRDSGWMIMADAGRSLRQSTDEAFWLATWLEVLPRYAELQLEASADLDALRATGIPALPLDELPLRYAEILEVVGAEQRFWDAGAEVERLCDRLAAFEVADTVQHDDLHDAQVFVLDGRSRVLDWGDACVSHPFFTLSVTLEGVLAWGLHDVADAVDLRPFREAYLAPFRAAYGGDLDAAVDVALRLGWVCRAVNGHVPGDDAHTLTRLRMFLDKKP